MSSHARDVLTFYLHFRHWQNWQVRQGHSCLLARYETEYQHAASASRSPRRQLQRIRVFSFLHPRQVVLPILQPADCGQFVHQCPWMGHSFCRAHSAGDEQKTISWRDSPGVARRRNYKDWFIDRQLGATQEHRICFCFWVFFAGKTIHFFFRRAEDPAIVMLRPCERELTADTKAKANKPTLVPLAESKHA